MSRLVGAAALIVLCAFVDFGAAQQRSNFSVGARDLQFKVVDTQKLTPSIDTTKFFRQPRQQSAPFSLSKFFPKFSLPLLPQKQVSSPIASPQQNPLRPPGAPLAFDPSKIRQ